MDILAKVLGISSTTMNSMGHGYCSFYGLPGAEPYCKGEDKKDENECTDTAGDVAVAYKECYVIPQWNLTFDDSLLPPWSGL